MFFCGGAVPSLGLHEILTDKGAGLQHLLGEGIGYALERLWGGIHGVGWSAILDGRRGAVPHGLRYQPNVGGHLGHFLVCGVKKLLMVAKVAPQCSLFPVGFPFICHRWRSEFRSASGRWRSFCLQDDRSGGSLGERKQMLRRLAQPGTIY